NGSRGVLVVLDIPDERAPGGSSPKVTEELWLSDGPKRLMVWGRFDAFIAAVVPAKLLRDRLREAGLRNARDGDRAHTLRYAIGDFLKARPAATPRIRPEHLDGILGLRVAARTAILARQPATVLDLLVIPDVGRKVARRLLNAGIVTDPHGGMDPGEGAERERWCEGMDEARTGVGRADRAITQD
ncbi:MAG: hypothetical protein WCJ30_23860, partial [Deltaproteobacteria bacterium]